MPQGLAIEAKFRLQDVEPDGQVCCGCGDTCWLLPKVLEFSVTVGNKESKWIRLPHFICGSCFGTISGPKGGE